MQVPVGVWIAAAVIAILLTWITLWVTNKAYSRRWEDNSSETEEQLIKEMATRKH